MQGYKQMADYCDNGGNTKDFQGAYYSRKERQYFPLLAMLEREYECAGVCQDQPCYTFTDVSRGAPKKNCREDLRMWMGEQPLRSCAVIVAVALFLVINVLCPCYLNCRELPSSIKRDEYALISTQI